jgi:hypothetical protein
MYLQLSEKEGFCFEPSAAAAAFGLTPGRFFSLGY